LAPLRKQAEALEARMHKLTSVIAKVDAALAEPDAFRREPTKAAELARMRAEAALALARIEEDWLAVSGEIEAGS
jgi:ATP-binding cassette subfamily F protein 3